ncbi:TPA: glutamine--fructose-6-phosphate transaminase (isomerizing) [Candidatus Saccharibacteria bacterium]|nr:glutamine--fructose-6-phosphate transaminase (isomerizing) [Candidatus Saccharibacteria bacterium]HRK40540.1 glutamine--fructose-6-phosphate transaminase (isomerizing) [Candidatus Saccharibacteria bacterium]
MCGIVGYIGSQAAQNILLGGLRRLEYRGYDSAGIITAGKNGETLLREKGKVAELDKKVAADERSDAIGIGHTRWATHGEPSERNAHPHHVGDIYLVHNGIIENYQDLKEVLADRGYEFASETDTEVFTALIDSIYQAQDKKDLHQAVVDSLQMVIGAYGIAVMAKGNLDEIVVARKGSPLVVGVGEQEVFIASDPSALVGHTDQVVYLRDDEVATCSKNGVHLTDAAATKVDAVVEKLELDIQAIQKKGYDHFLLKEIFEQPETLRSTLNGRVLKEQDLLRLGGLNMTDGELREVKNVFIIGCGTAYYAGMLASYFIEQFTDDVVIHNAIASELRYRSFNLPENSIALFVSQSGETADTLACLQEMKRRGVKCLGIVNAVGSSIAREVDGGVYVHVGSEISVASTKAFTSQAVAMLLFGLVIAQAKGMSLKELRPYIVELDILPDEIQSTLDSQNEPMKTLAKKYAHYEHALYVGRDSLFPVALEGALKLKEISYIQSEGYAAGELKHGPIALIDDKFFEMAFVSDNWLYEKTMSNIIEMKARGGHIITVTNSEKAIDAEEVVRVDTKLELLAPLIFNVVSQLFAYYVAVERGNDVDQPRNLAKSVTVE